MIRFILLWLLVIALSPLCAAAAGWPRDRIQIVGSSTVFPFARAVSENFAKNTGHPSPQLSSTGSGGGFQLFCQGNGPEFPDISNSSRRIKPAEIDLCRTHGVTDIVEIKIGYGGIVLANLNTAPEFSLSNRDIFLALAARVPVQGEEGRLIANPYTRWQQLDRSLPDQQIIVLGPPLTSGTRDLFTELAMERGCQSIPWIRALKKHHKQQYREICETIRDDGTFIEAGERDELIVKALHSRPMAFGIFGYNFLARDRKHLQGAAIEQVLPSPANIVSGAYPLARSLYFYIKKAHLAQVPGLKDYVAEFTSDPAWGPDGYLAELNLIVMPAEERVRYRRIAQTGTALAAD
ncbi:substrate-binding domain-containing protein [Pelobacter seleniigenes]|uniref:substrate-binding domain-containing protein n=1 Tax=Pelobacter seleniigenes TaxID=407188 RepID=UPI0004A76DEE|nr:substrate-binding domain-containing protein [Pelobacter seleniigenes]